MAKAPKESTAADIREKIITIIPAPAGLLATVDIVQGPDAEAPPVPVKKLALALALCEDEDGVQYIRAVTDADIQGEVQL